MGLEPGSPLLPLKEPFILLSVALLEHCICWWTSLVLAAGSMSYLLTALPCLLQLSVALLLKTGFKPKLYFNSW